MKLKRMCFIWEVCSQHNKAAWSAYGVGLLVVLMAFSAILQPTPTFMYKLSGVHGGNKTRRMQLDFANTTVGPNPVLMAQFTVKTLPNVRWGLGFDIRDGQERGAYVWLYHDVVDAETLQTYLRLWITCIMEDKNPLYLDNPWNGSSWNPTEDNDLTIKLTQNKILLLTGVNDAQEDINCSLSMDWSQMKVELECWSLEGQCPMVTQNCKEELWITVILNVASMASMGIILGLGLSVLWVRFINISLYHVVWWTSRKKMSNQQ